MKKVEWHQVKAWYEAHGFFNAASNIQETRKYWSADDLMEFLEKKEKI